MSRYRYQEIVNIYKQAIESGTYGLGDVLPSEAKLMDQFSVSRVTIRKALEELKALGLVTSRQGYGWTIGRPILEQSLDALVTIEEQLQAQGVNSTRNVLSFGMVKAPRRLSILGPRVLKVDRLHLADSQPFARVRVWCSETVAGAIERSQIETTSFLDLLGGTVVSAVQRLTAEPADTQDAELLGVDEDSPVLVVRRFSYGADEQALLASELVFPGHLTEFVTTLTAQVTPAEAALRLVDT